jgi:transglutaminase-like putative cysteine protease
MYMWMNRAGARPAALRMFPGPEAQCTAAQELVRPDEVMHLVVPCCRPAWRTWPEEVARWLRSEMAAGRLTYFADALDPFGRDEWCSPSETLRRGGGDCDDHAVLALSLLRADGTPAWIVVGTWFGEGHAWVEGSDDRGFFHLEAVRGEIRRYRPAGYRAAWAFGPGICEPLN